jgi:hypothetical protein
MNRIRRVLTEICGLFVDDGLFALGILGVLVIGWALPRLGLPDWLSCLLFTIGLAALLLVNTAHRARKRR